MTIVERFLRLSCYFEVGAHANVQAVEALIADSIPPIRRYLDDPINAAVIGQRHDPARNALMALLLAVDRAGFEPGTLSLLPADPACNQAAHAPGAAARCHLCAVMRVVAIAQRNGFIRVRKVAGDKDETGHYVRATDLAIEPGPAMADYREKIKRLSLPLLMAAAPGSGGASGEAGPEPVAGQARKQLALLRAASWDELSFEIGALDFTVSGVSGNRADLGLSRDLWALLGEFARNDGQLRPKLLAGYNPHTAQAVEALRLALKASFPQIPGNPIEGQAGGAYKAAFAVKPGGGSGGGLHWS